MFKYIVGLLVISLYIFPLLSEIPVSVDRELIIEPLEKIQTPAEYFEALTSRKLSDIQPVKDFFHFIDLKLNSFFSTNKAGLWTNLLLLALVLYFCFLVLSHYFKPDMARLGCSLIALHPTTFHIFVEETQKKHILSFLFGLIILNQMLTSQGRIKRHMYYFLSLASHIINYSMIFWIPILKFIQNRDIKSFVRQVLIPLVILIFFILVTLFAYDVPALYQQPTQDLDWTKLFAGIGLFFRQYFAPLSHAIYYDITHPINYIFLCFGLGIFWWTSKRSQEIFFLNAIGFSSLILVLYGVKSGVRSLYYYAPYSLTPLLLFTLMTLLWLSSTHNRIKFGKFFILPLLFSISLFYSFQRSSKYDFYKSNFDWEKNCRVAEYITVEAIKRGKVDDLLYFGDWWFQTKCNSYKRDYLRAFVLSHLVFESEQLSYQQKITFFEQLFPPGLDLQLLEIAMNIKMGKEFSIAPLLALKPEKNSLYLKSSYISNNLNQNLSQTDAAKMAKLFNSLDGKPIHFQTIGKVD